MAAYTARIKSSSQLSGRMTMSVVLEVFKDEVLDHEIELDVKAITYTEEIREYLSEYKEAQDIIDAVEEGEVITL